MKMDDSLLWKYSGFSIIYRCLWNHVWSQSIAFYEDSCLISLHRYLWNWCFTSIHRFLIRKMICVNFAISSVVIFAEKFQKLKNYKNDRNFWTVGARKNLSPILESSWKCLAYKLSCQSFRVILIVKYFKKLITNHLRVW